MEELGISSERIGSSDHRLGIARCAFHPQESDAGGLASGGRINVDSGVLNPSWNADGIGPEASSIWARAPLKERIGAAIAHEDTGWRLGSHEAAVEHAPESELPILPGAGALLRAIRRGETAIRGGGSSRDT